MVISSTFVFEDKWLVIISSYDKIDAVHTKSWLLVSGKLFCGMFEKMLA